jgi:hypothetical protein
MAIEEGMDVDELIMQDFLQGYDSVSGSMEFETGYEFKTTLGPWCFL